MRILRLIVGMLLFPFFPGASAALFLFDRRIRLSVRLFSFAAAVLLSIHAVLFWQDLAAAPPALVQSEENEVLVLSENGRVFHEEDTVYYTPGGKVFHTEKTCPGLAHSINVQEGTLRRVLRMKKRTPCKFCCASQAEEDAETS